MARRRYNINETSITAQLYLTILESIRLNHKLPENLMSKSLMRYYISRLKKEGKIRRIGYGTWEVIEPQKTSITELGVTKNTLLKPVSPVRLHNLVFKVKVDYYNWVNVLSKSGVYFEEVHKGVFRVVYDGFKVWLVKGGVVVYVKPNFDFKADFVAEALRLGIEWFYGFYASFEAFLGLRATPSGDLVWGFSRKHISLVDYVVARDFVVDGVKFRVFDKRGLWLIADRSFNVNELEGIRNVDNGSSMRIIQAVFNDYKDNPSIPLPSEAYLLVLELIKGLGVTKATIDSIVKRLGWED